MHGAHFTNILLIIEAVDDGAGAEEKYCFKESVRADMEEGQLWLIEADSDYYEA